MLMYEHFHDCFPPLLEKRRGRVALKNISAAGAEAAMTAGLCDCFCSSLLFHDGFLNVES